jgi:hypothetical protein
VWRKMEALRDRIMFGIGTAEPWYRDDELLAKYGIAIVSVNWRKPLRFEEVNRMAPTSEVLARKGRG